MWVLCFGCSTGSPWPRRSGRLVSPDEFLFHLVADPKMKFLRRLIVLVDDATVSGGELNGVAHGGAEYCLEIESRADSVTDLAERLQFVNRFRFSTLASSRRALQKISLQAATRHRPIAFDSEGSPLDPYRGAGSSRKKSLSY